MIFEIIFKLKKTALTFLVLWVIAPLLVGTLIYFLFRPVSIVIFNIFNETQINSILEFRKSIGVSNWGIPKWIVNSLPDGLWIFTFTNLLNFIWKDQNGFLKQTFLLIPLGIGLVHEFLQFIIPDYGTFDVLDIIIYLIFYYSSVLLKKVFLTNK